ncbi:MAG: NAD(P)-dependent oxidoreductase [Nitrososphaeria archaeon]|nr:NAD(P)-dependent oxidoreductase [Nitrososphaeria archaeon]
MAKNMKVLVTGASGRIGRAFIREYKNYYTFRLMLHKKSLDTFDVEVVYGDIADFNSVLNAVKGVDAIVHLAADARVEAEWNSVLNTNIIGTYNVFEAARLCNVKKVVYASSNHACGTLINEKDIVGPDAPIAPDSLYGVSKVFGEALAHYYFKKYGLSIICLRIGICRDLDDPSQFFREYITGQKVHPTYSPEKILGLWISAHDMAQLIHKSLESDIKFGIFYGISNNRHPVFDLSETKAKLGYIPEDCAEKYL